MTTLTTTRHAYDEHVDSRRHDASAVLLDPERLSDYVDPLYRAACALCASRHDADDLVQETFARVLKRPRLVRRNNELAYLLRALRNTCNSHHRAAARRPATAPLAEDVTIAAPEAGFGVSEITRAVASAPPAFRDAVIAVDIVGMSYKEAARALRAREATITTRLHRGRQHVARVLAAADETH